jgi:hypothetical protein
MITADDMIGMLPDDPDEAAALLEQLSLTPAQHNWLCRGKYPVQSSTFDSLARKGLVDPDRNHGITDLGMAFVRRVMDKNLEWLKTCIPEGVPFIDNDKDLLVLLDADEENDIYVYRGSQPLVVNDGNGQKPLACLHPFYWWQIEVAKTHGKFLQRYSIIGHKGSYGYNLKTRG